jgi:hypothetical protein
MIERLEQRDPFATLPYREPLITHIAGEEETAWTIHDQIIQHNQELQKRTPTSLSTADLSPIKKFFTEL